MDTLPNELLDQIALNLDDEPPSVYKFSHEPSTQLTSSKVTNLKALSLVSWKWRKITLPILFRFCQIRLDPDPQWVPIDARLIESMQGQLTRLSNHEFLIYQKMRSKLKTSSVFAFGEAFDDLLMNLCRVQDGDDFLKSAPHVLWLPHLPPRFSIFAQFVACNNLKNRIKSLVVYTEKEYELRHVATADAPLSRAVTELWTRIFLHLEPLRVVVAAPPSTLAGLLDTQMLSSDTWAFDMKMHYIELRQPEPIRHHHLDSSCRPWGVSLIHQRPWSHLAYNEGSSVSAYSTYEYHLKQSPKMLYLILSRLAKEVRACCNIESFSFFAVFPFGTNTSTVIRALQRIPTLRQVQFKLAPGSENDLLSSTERMGRAQPRDLWLEWNESYRAIAGFLGTYDFSDGSEFVSSDMSQLRVANEVDDYMQLLHDRGNGWSRMDDGVWVRDHSLDVRVSTSG
ncbi:hypothetical protein BS50DRAFT_496157 [Corynespora cassiicola Philippines]|uniref:F-box domain-containing protein n=1 Tax=Corynespora cassiicola Philippines TaxID=1448308 RepID=A0A2T2NMQ4_CORCC|nr:hypothetical protein BS50DRAFT_496157 [Corynespora cassiicola Philippines]